MFEVALRFRGSLVFFLYRRGRRDFFTARYRQRRSLKDLIESYGIPHVEVGAVLSRGSRIDMNYIPGHDDSIVLYPYYWTDDVIDTGSVIPAGGVRFISDVHLRKLVRLMRFYGHDVLFNAEWDDSELAHVAAAGDRILLTRDSQLLMRKEVAYGYYLRSQNSDEQLEEILARWPLNASRRMRSRCMVCNGIIKRITGDESDYAALTVPPEVAKWCSEYFRCTGCGKIYWKGSHYDRIAARVSMAEMKFR